MNRLIERVFPLGASEQSDILFYEKTAVAKTETQAAHGNLYYPRVLLVLYLQDQHLRKAAHPIHVFL